jgi:uncharacterized protein YhbP (UPF0306 family)
MVTEPAVLERALKLIRESRYMVLATSAGTRPWAATINYVVKSGGQLLYYSSPTARHSQDIGIAANVAVAIYSVGSDGDVDGLQLTGRCQMVTQVPIIDDVHQQYYLRNFPDPNVRSDWLIDRSQFDEGGTHRFYTVDIEECWVMDTDQWPLDKVDRRLAVPVEELAKELQTD